MLLLIPNLNLTSGDVYYYITPTQDDPCDTDDPCLTLSEFAANASGFIKSNTTLFITRGFHSLDTNLSVSNVATFSMLFMKQQDNQSYLVSTAEISCIESSKFVFSTVDRVHIRGLTFIGCGNNRVDLVNQLVIEGSKFVGRNFSETPLVESETNVHLTETSFVSNTAKGMQVSTISFNRYLQMMLKSSIPLSDATTGGALILTRQSTLTVDKCLFQNNSAQIGGAIFLESGGNVIITNSVFTSNRATGCVLTEQCHGGALFIDGSGSVTITNTTFQNNTSGGEGGVAVVFNATTLTLSQSELSNNSAANGYGGALACYECDPISISTTNFDNNRANSDGGSLYLYRSSLTVHDSEFSYNRGNGVGGSIASVNSRNSIDITNSRFIYNSAAMRGGVVSFTQGRAAATIQNSYFLHNSAQEDGGVVYAEFGTNLEFINCTVVNNTASGQGGVLFAQNESSALISGSTILNNTAMIGGVAYVAGKSSIDLNGRSSFTGNRALMDGGVVLNDNSTVSVANSSFSCNEAGKNGGVLSTQNSTTPVVISDSNFIANVAMTSGGVIHTMDYVEILVNESTFQGNTAGKEGSALDGFSLQILKSVFTENFANSSGGVVRLRQGGNLNVERSNFQNNTGGVIYADTQTVIDIHQGSFVGNSRSATRGGVISVAISRNLSDRNCGGTSSENSFDSNITIHDSIFTENGVPNAGGVIYGNEKIYLRVQNGTFFRNSANTGGVISVRCNSVADISDSVFRNNSASSNGGVITAQMYDTVTFTRSTFVGNGAVSNGAVIFISDRTDVIIRESCEFYQNRANFGGVLFALQASSVSIEGGTFSGNKADTDGGILHIRKACRISITKSTFTNNSVINDGLLFASDHSNITLEDCPFSHNEAGDDGGVGYVYDNSKITTNNCNLSSNKAGDTGGSFYARMSSTVVVNNSQVYNSTVENSGGVVYVQQGSNVVIESSTLQENSADYGGVVRVYVGSSANIFNSSFSGNVGNIEGGAIGAYKSSAVTVQASCFTLNAANFGGVSVVYDSSNLTLVENQFINNSAISGAVIRVLRGNFLTVTRNTIRYNKADSGGAVSAQGIRSEITFESNQFEHNSVRLDGGAIHGDNVTISLTNDTFSNNTAGDDGGAIALLDASIADIYESSFQGNSAADTGGAIDLLQESRIRVFDSRFSLSGAGGSGGALYATSGFVEISNCTFSKNEAVKSGGVMAARKNSSLVIRGSSFTGNGADESGGVLYLEENSGGEVIGSSFEFNDGGERGGVVSLATTSNVSITASNFTENSAYLGGVLAAEESSSISFTALVLDDDSDINIDNNTASSDGGGVYLCESTLFLKTKTNIINNSAFDSGGGIHAIDSSITISGVVNLSSNQAIWGGGLSLEDSKLYNDAVQSELGFVLNRADYGGAVFVDDTSDESLDSICFSDSSDSPMYPYETGCFIQNLTPDLAINFGDNFATSSGDNLFGGLLDRCTVVSLMDSSMFVSGAVARLEEISNIDRSSLNTISSDPVRVCFCGDDNLPDCSRQNYSIEVKRGDAFSIPVAAVDQVNNPVTATVQSNFKQLSLPVSETVQRIAPTCTNLTFQVLFPTVEIAYDLTLYAEGPCSDEGISRFDVSVFVLRCSCGRGFVQANISTECVCNCDNRFETFARYIQDNCDPNTGTIIRKGQFWMTYLDEYENSSISPYLFYSFCPLDYCQPPSNDVHINLNLPNGSDAQCANNRGGLLCGGCLGNYSLSLGSSKCLVCPDNWYIVFGVITGAAILAGIFLVIVLLVLNITVAIGTINSIIFYANIVNANRDIYFSQPNLTFVPVFISWLNLDIGFDTCYFPGMNTYIKTWLQLVFPTYIIFLVILVIILSSISSKFSNLLGKKNPVATLATLILLSYTKYLQIIIASFSYATLEYPNHTIIKWFPDANVRYLEWKHILLICVAILTIIIGFVYTILIFFWQWFLRCSRSRLFNWTRNSKLNAFIDTYHAPHTAKHRYWTGLLLFVRVVIYIVAAFTLAEDPRITLLTTLLVTCFLSLYKTLLIVRVYKNWLLNAMESFVYFNIASFTIFTWYTFDDLGNEYKRIFQTVAAYVSVGTILILLSLVLVYHAYRYCSTTVYTFGESTRCSKALRSRLSLDVNENDGHRTPYERDDYNFFNAIDNPRREGGSAYVKISANRNEDSPHTGTTTSSVSMNNCKESISADRDDVFQSGRQSLGSQTSIENEHVESGSSGEGYRAEPHPHELSDSFRLRGVDSGRKGMTKSFTFGTKNKSITKPLLEEVSL